MSGRRASGFRRHWSFLLPLLLRRRPELREVSPTAAYLDEAWRWSA